MGVTVSRHSEITTVIAHAANRLKGIARQRMMPTAITSGRRRWLRPMPGAWMRRLALSALMHGCSGAHAADILDVAIDKRFSATMAQVGMERPFDFHAAGLYIAAEIDRTKEVVLFVHGAYGTPRDFLDVARGLDHARQQAWYAYYATGKPIAESAGWIAGQVSALMQAHGLTRVRVLGHSMGGLVAWHAIAELERRMDVLQLISVNTPWGGDIAAQWGAWLSPAPLPVWFDLAPGSQALMKAQAGRLRTRFTLVYTVKDDAAHFLGDGTISHGSAVHPAMLQQSDLVVRQKGNHMSALRGGGARLLADLLRRDEARSLSSSSH